MTAKQRILTAILISMSVSTSILAEETKAEKISILGAVSWYADNCNNVNEKGVKKLEVKALEHNLTPKTWGDNSYFKSGRGVAWFMGCEGIHKKMVKKELTEYLICKEDISSNQSFGDICNRTAMEKKEKSTSFFSF
jgi:hypothetical protein